MKSRKSFKAIGASYKGIQKGKLVCRYLPITPSHDFDLNGELEMWRIAATVPTSSKPTALLMSSGQESIRSDRLFIATHPTCYTDLNGNVAAGSHHIFILLYLSGNIWHARLLMYAMLKYFNILDDLDCNRMKCTFCAQEKAVVSWNTEV